jgi:hypothetical protein
MGSFGAFKYPAWVTGEQLFYLWQAVCALIINLDFSPKIDNFQKNTYYSC